MSDRTSPEPRPAPAKEHRPLYIEPDGIYSPTALARLLQEAVEMRPSCVRREIKLRRLRAAKRGGRLILLGRWILEWLAAGQLPPPRPRTPTPDA
jgi:hypothetical protein